MIETLGFLAHLLERKKGIKNRDKKSLFWILFNYMSTPYTFIYIGLNLKPKQLSKANPNQLYSCNPMDLHIIDPWTKAVGRLELAPFWT